MINGGQAFPCMDSDSTSGLYLREPGMTLRDYFAARAMRQFFFEGSPQSRAKSAYAEADAMLAEREKHK